MLFVAVARADARSPLAAIRRHHAAGNRNRSARAAVAAADAGRTTSAHRRNGAAGNRNRADCGIGATADTRAPIPARRGQGAVAGNRDRRRTFNGEARGMPAADERVLAGERQRRVGAGNDRNGRNPVCRAVDQNAIDHDVRVRRDAHLHVRRAAGDHVVHCARKRHGRRFVFPAFVCEVTDVAAIDGEPCQFQDDCRRRAVLHVRGVLHRIAAILRHGENIHAARQPDAKLARIVSVDVVHAIRESSLIADDLKRLHFGVRLPEGDIHRKDRRRRAVNRRGRHFIQFGIHRASGDRHGRRRGAVYAHDGLRPSASRGRGEDRAARDSHRAGADARTGVVARRRDHAAVDRHGTASATAADTNARSAIATLRRQLYARGNRDRAACATRAAADACAALSTGHIERTTVRAGKRQRVGRRYLDAGRVPARDKAVRTRELHGRGGPGPDRHGRNAIPGLRGKHEV